MHILVWDLPTRLLHWIFAGLVIGALGFALAAGDHGDLFRIHMLLGLSAAFVAVLRVVWGVVGTRYARFGSFLFGPRALRDYLFGVFRRGGEPHVGHNPGSAYATFAMLLLSVGLALSAMLMPSSEALEELHEVMAYAMLLVIVGHLAGVVLHTIRRRDNIALSMISGKKVGPAAQAIRSSRSAVGVVFLALAISWTALVFTGFDQRTGQLTVFGQAFCLSGDRSHERSDQADDDDEHHRWRRHREKRGRHGHHEVEHHDQHGRHGHD